MTKKLMALLLAVLMAVSLLPMPAMAGDAQVITDLSGISAGGSYVVDKSVKDIVLSAPLTLDKDVTLVAGRARPGDEPGGLQPLHRGRDRARLEARRWAIAPMVEAPSSHRVHRGTACRSRRVLIRRSGRVARRAGRRWALS